MIPTRVHGVLDYVVGGLLIVVGAVFYGTDNAAGLTPIILGAGTILYSLATAYELGIVKLIPMPVHLGLDFVAGVVLAASPWLLDYADIGWVPHVLVGLMEVGIVLLSQRVPGTAPMMPAH